MVEVVATTKPKVHTDMGTHDQTGRCLAPHPKNPSSMAATALCRQTPEVGAVCPNWASTDLCGGRSVMGVSTAIDVAPDLCRHYLAGHWPTEIGSYTAPL